MSQKNGNFVVLQGGQWRWARVFQPLPPPTGLPSTYVTAVNIKAQNCLFLRQPIDGVSIHLQSMLFSGRDKFESHLRTRGIYESCLSRYFLMNKQGADWTTVMTYIRLYQHLDFICNQGFERMLIRNFRF